MSLKQDVADLTASIAQLAGVVNANRPTIVGATQPAQRDFLADARASIKSKTKAPKVVKGPGVITYTVKAEVFDGEKGAVNILRVSKLHDGQPDYRHPHGKVMTLAEAEALFAFMKSLTA